MGAAPLNPNNNAVRTVNKGLREVAQRVAHLLKKA
jgi:hypothetical protein